MKTYFGTKPVTLKMKNENPQKELVITNNTLEKIKTYCKIICEKENNEIYGFLLNPKKRKDLSQSII